MPSETKHLATVSNWPRKSANWIVSNWQKWFYPLAAFLCTGKPDLSHGNELGQVNGGLNAPNDVKLWCCKCKAYKITPSCAASHNFQHHHAKPFPQQGCTHPIRWLPGTPVFPWATESCCVLSLLYVWLREPRKWLDITVRYQHQSWETPNSNQMFWAKVPQPLHLLWQTIQGCIGRLPHLMAKSASLEFCWSNLLPCWRPEALRWPPSSDAMPNSPGGRDAIAVPAALEEAPLNLAVAAGPRLAVQPPDLVFFS